MDFVDDDSAGLTPTHGHVRQYRRQGNNAWTVCTKVQHQENEKVDDEKQKAIFVHNGRIHIPWFQSDNQTEETRSRMPPKLLSGPNTRRTKNTRVQKNNHRFENISVRSAILEHDRHRHS